MARYGIIAIGYNRPDSLNRLLDALSKAEYFNDNVLLIISIDNGGVAEVGNTAEKFEWSFGEKVVIQYDKRQGLRNHILKCGSYIEKYDLDAAAVFEDDVYPSPAFYNFMRQAVPKYSSDKSIAGISLYTHLWNVNAQMPFLPAKEDNSDIFLMQFAQSWGQIWLRRQWSDFAQWYENNSNEFREADGVPEFVSTWPKTSWLKYHIRYCVEKNKYFVYPYCSLTTCFTDVGEHNARHNTIYQVPMDYSCEKKYCLPNSEQCKVQYDAFFERMNIGNWLGIKDEELIVDLYGTKKEYSGRRYLITCNYYSDCTPIKSYSLELKPHELNIKAGIPGNNIYMYKCDEIKKDNECKHPFFDDIMLYYHRVALSSKYMLKLLVKRIKNKIIK